MTTNPKPRIDFASYRELQRLAAENRAAALVDESRPALALVQPTAKAARLERMADQIVAATKLLIVRLQAPLERRIAELERRLAEREARDG